MSYKMKGFSGFKNSPVKSKQLKKVVKELKGAVEAHGRQANVVEDHIDKMEESPVKKRGLWDNIHAKRKRGEKMRSKGDKGAPTEKALKESQSPAKCWEGYKRVPGTKEFSKGSCKKI
tara:strand:- start:129 stop:482 length:354 start_codon:yes stop_codon:yes gene_type:complete